LVNDDIPLNAGCMKPLEVIIPQGCMLPTFRTSKSSIQKLHLRVMKN